jgi:Sulfatase
LGETAARNAPAINQFLRESTVFKDAITPLARTFPSWVSILSGRHPHTTGAVINLFPREQIQEGDSLPKLLGKAGYRTVYAIDEVRFSNLDKSYGFDEMISPPMGASDFLLGFFSDSPLANLLVNTRVGAHLFPYSHGNRAISTTYDPDTFVNMIDRNMDFEEPTFLTVHMTLAHWPFTWASSEPRLDATGAVDPVGLYEQAVARLDRQFKDVIEVLRRQGALDNAIVVVLSDHGESLGERDFALAPASADTDAVRHAIYGHGTNVLSNHQYQVVLGMREFGETPLALKPGTSITLPVSLEDVAPTLVDVLGIQGSTPFDGVSLAPLLHGHALAGTMDFKNRIRYMETEFNPPGVALGQTVTPSALTDAAEFYRIDPDTDRILIREEFMEEILANRQYAASRNGRVLASLPATGGLDRPLAYLEGPESAPRWIGAEVGKQAEPELAELRLALESRFPAIQRGASPPAGAATE